MFFNHCIISGELSLQTLASKWLLCKDLQQRILGHIESRISEIYYNIFQICELTILYKMPGCAAVGCTNSAKKGFLMKRFPKDPQRRKAWAVKMRRDNWFPTDSSVLCEVNIFFLKSVIQGKFK